MLEWRIHAGALEVKYLRAIIDVLASIDIFITTKHADVLNRPRCHCHYFIFPRGVNLICCFNLKVQLDVPPHLSIVITVADQSGSSEMNPHFKDF